MQRVVEKLSASAALFTQRRARRAPLAPTLRLRNHLLCVALRLGKYDQKRAGIVSVGNPALSQRSVSRRCSSGSHAPRASKLQPAVSQAKSEEAAPLPTQKTASAEHSTALFGLSKVFEA